MSEPIICPGCGHKRTPGDPLAVAELDACCNPACLGQWGTGCWHCHHPSFATSERTDRASKLAVRLWAMNLGLWESGTVGYTSRPITLAANPDGSCSITAPASDAMGYQIKLDPVCIVAWPTALLWALCNEHELSIGECTGCGLDEEGYFAGGWAQRIRDELRATPGQWKHWARDVSLSHHDRRAMQARANKLAQVGALKRQRSGLRPNTFEFQLACCGGHGIDKRSIGELLLHLARGNADVPRAAEVVTTFADHRAHQGDPLGLGLLTWLRERELGEDLDPSWQAACVWALVRDLLPHGLTCPTCSSEPPSHVRYDKPQPGKCCSCFSVIPLEDQELHPDPYADDIHGDSALHLQCENCREQSAADI